MNTQPNTESNLDGTDRRIGELVRASIDPDELPVLDPAVLRAEASRRTTRRRILVATVSALGVSALLPVGLAITHDESPQASSSTPSAESPPVGHPACLTIRA